MEASFSTVTVREYPMTLGDNPCVHIGPPVSIGWEYLEFQPTAMNDYESDRPQVRNGKDMYLQSEDRIRILMAVGVTKDDQTEAMEEVRIAQQQRIESKIEILTIMAQESMASNDAKGGKFMAKEVKKGVAKGFVSARLAVRNARKFSFIGKQMAKGPKPSPVVC